MQSKEAVISGTRAVAFTGLLLLAGCTNSDDSGIRQAPTSVDRDGQFSTVFGLTLEPPEAPESSEALQWADPTNCGRPPIVDRVAEIEVVNERGGRVEGLPEPRGPFPPFVKADLVARDGRCVVEVLALGLPDQLSNAMTVRIDGREFPISIEEFLAGETKDVLLMHVIER